MCTREGGHVLVPFTLSCTHTKNTYTHLHNYTRVRYLEASHLSVTDFFLRYEYTVPGWRRPVGCLISCITFRKLAINYRALLRKMTYKDKGCYECLPGCNIEMYNIKMYMSTRENIEASQLSIVYSYLLCNTHTHTRVIHTHTLAPSLAPPDTHAHTCLCQGRGGISRGILVVRQGASNVPAHESCHI